MLLMPAALNTENGRKGDVEIILAFCHPCSPVLPSADKTHRLVNYGDAQGCLALAARSRQLVTPYTRSFTIAYQVHSYAKRERLTAVTMDRIGWAAVTVLLTSDGGSGYGRR